jgi:2-iminobutanoate/2-iminopropanoate deaminase
VKREVIRVEPLSTYLENWKAPTSAVIRSGDTIYVSGFPPFDPDTGQIIEAPIERQTEIVLEQMKLCVETAGSSLQCSSQSILRTCSNAMSIAPQLRNSPP